MNGWGITIRRGDGAGPRVLSLATVVCLILLTLLTVVQVAHLHPFDQDADHCPLCIVMHSAAPVAVAATAIILVQLGTQTTVLVPVVLSRHRHPKLFIRPPPSNF